MGGVANPLHHSGRARAAVAGSTRSTRSSTSTSRRSGGRRGRNPATYIGLFDHIRDLYSRRRSTAESRPSPSTSRRARCEVCGRQIDRDALPPGRLPCRASGASATTTAAQGPLRARRVLDRTVEESVTFFEHIRRSSASCRRFTTSAWTTLSWASPRRRSPGESAACQAGVIATGRTLYILDEPTARPALRRTWQAVWRCSTGWWSRATRL